MPNSRSLRFASAQAPEAKRQRRHRKARYRWVLAVFVVVTVALVCVVAPTWDWQSAEAQNHLHNAANGEKLEASGAIRAEEVLIASEYSGRIDAILVHKGQAVVADQVLVRLDTALLDAQIEAAKAAVALAEARLDQVRAGARPGQIAVAEAQWAQAQAACIAAMQAVSGTMALVENPQEIRMQIAVLRAQIEAEEHRLAEKLALKDAAEIGKDQFRDAQKKIIKAGGPGRRKVPIPGVPGAFYEYTVPSLPLEAHLAPNYWWQAWVGVNATAAQKEGLEASLAHLYVRQEQPQDLETQADEALARLAQAEAQVVAAQARVNGLKAGAIQEQIAALEARVEQARASLGLLVSQREMMEIRAPVDGVIVSLSAHGGEVVASGATLLTVADLARVKLTVYVPETQLGKVSLGQDALVAVDSFPERVFGGTVTHIADRAEFTPRNVTTQEERVNLVFAVEISLDNAEGALKPGMPADATFGG
jgi:multidrug resistance efflux pump